MNLLTLFIRRPVATSLLTLAIALPGLIAFLLLPIASLPQVDFPVINVSASLPGASPETMAGSVATPLERSLGRIAGIDEMTSTNSQGLTRINLQFELNKDIDTAAREVQAAINAAQALLPSGMPSKPSYRKANAAGLPIIALALTSDTLNQAQLYDVAFNVLVQNISQIRGVGQVGINASSPRAVRVEINPTALNQYGISLEQVRAAINAANVNRPVGFIEDDNTRWQLDVNDQALKASDYRNLIVVRRANGNVVRLRDVANVIDSVQELRNAGTSSGKPAVMLSVQNQPGANIVETVDAIRAMLPRLQGMIPAAVKLDVNIDRSTTIRKSLREVEHTLLISIGLVVLVTFLFLRSGRATLIPTIAIPVSLLGTLAVIYLLGFSLNNLSLMALIISTSFVVDDAIVIVERVTHHIENGLKPFEAAVQGVRDVGFTIIAMSASLIAVFVPLLFMGGVIGRLFGEFAITLAVAVGISLIVSLTTTPMLCAKWLKAKPVGGDTPTANPGRIRRVLAAIAQTPLRLYGSSLAWALRHGIVIVLLLLTVIGLNVYLYGAIPKGLFPQQDTGRLNGNFQGDQSLSFAAMRNGVEQIMTIIGQDPAIDTFYEYSGGWGGGQSNGGSFFARLKPLEERKVTAAEVVARIRPKIARVPGVTLFINAQQDVNIGARIGGAQYQYSILASDMSELRTLAPRLRAAMSRLPELTDVNSDFQDKGLQTLLTIDRNTASRLGISARQIDATLNNAFGQRQISTIYEPLNQYYVVLTLAPAYTQSAESLAHIYLPASNGNKVPLSAIARWEINNAPLAINHQGQFTVATVSFNLADGVSLDRASAAIEQAFAELNPPNGARGTLAGTAKVFNESLASQPWLILAALLAVYIVLGMLYESTIHPLTILSTLPSAGIGALLGLMAFNTEFSIIAFIGVILLVGVVMKNAIIMIDSALQIEREQGLPPAEAIRQACLQRFRPILMTTLAAMLGALPLALGASDGAELRRPLGISIVGGLIFSQLLTLYTTPVIYLYLDRLRLWSKQFSWRRKAATQLVSKAA